MSKYAKISKNIIKYVTRNKNIKLIGITSKKNSILYRNSDIAFLMPNIKEAGLENIVPTSSQTPHIQNNYKRYPAKGGGRRPPPLWVVFFSVFLLVLCILLLCLSMFTYYLGYFSEYFSKYFSIFVDI